MNRERKRSYEDFRYVKTVTLGSVNPNQPLSEESRKKQAALLNRCLSESPKGVIIGKDTTIGRFSIGEHELTLQQTSYHVGFDRKPLWLSD